MDSDEQCICDFLKTFPQQFVSGKEIARRAAGKKRYRDNPYWANSLLLRMAEKGALESDDSGRFRLPLPSKKKKTPKRWIAPHIQELLKQSGKQFEEVIEIDDSEAPNLL